MNTKWEKVKEVFNLALEQPTFSRQKFLKENFGENKELLDEVNSLLKVYDEPENLIEKNAVSFNQSTPKKKIVSTTQCPGVSASQLKGDLDNIILTALRKEPLRRYKSVTDFSDDISKYLKGLPVSARPNTYKYRAEKYIKRHKIGVLAGALILLSLIGGLVISLSLYRTSRQAVAKAEAVNLFMQKMLQTGNPETISTGNKGYSATVGDILADAVKRIENGELDSQPDVKAEVLQVIAEAFLTQNEYDTAEKLLRQLLILQTNLYNEENPRLLKTETALASLLVQKSKSDEAEEIYRKILPQLDQEYRRGTIEPTYLASAISDYALVCRARGDSAKAENLFRQILEIANQSKMPVQYKLGSMALLSLTLMDQGKFDEAETLFRQSIEILREQSAVETTQMGNLHTGLGSVLSEKGNLEEAESNLKQAEEIYRKLQSPNSVPIFDNLRLQAQVLYFSGKFTEAEMLINRVLEGYDKNSNSKYINYANAVTIKGLTLNKLGKSEEAEKLLRQAVQLRAETLPANHFMTALTKSALGEILSDRTNLTEAETLLRESYESLKQSQGEDNPRTILAKSRLTKLEQLSPK
jgi:eukaryotic-like serine/threonine-protein kinase